jgi:hypothetical protein
LEHHLDPSLDPSEAIRAVYGQWFPWLDLLDHEWTATNRDRIFPLDTAQDRLFRAAWETYVTFCDVYNVPADLLLEGYRRAITRIGSASPFRNSGQHLETRLAEHIAVLYWRARTNLEEEDGLVRLFYKHSSDELRAHAISFLGRGLECTKFTSATLDRLKNLWIWRLNIAKESPQGHPKELAAFGSWFAHYGRIRNREQIDPTWAQIDNEWMLSHLETALRLVGSIEREREVVGRLASLSSKFPLSCVNCLRLLVDGNQQGLGHFVWRDAARVILTTALSSELRDAREAAKALVNVFVARGISDYIDLLGDN